MSRPMTKSDALGIALALFLLALLTPVLFAQAGQAKEITNRRVCMTNLKGISTSFNLYASDNDDWYPYIPATSATTYDATLKEDKGSKDAEATTHGIYTDKKWPNNPMADLWLLVLSGGSPARQFICPSDTFATKPAHTSTDNLYLTNFSDKTNISYSMAFPWALDKDKKVVPGELWKSNQDSDLALLSDMAPYLGTKAQKGEAATQPDYGSDPDPFFTKDWNAKVANSQNHNFAGQNVAYGDGHVNFVKTPAANNNADSIWCIRKDDGDTPKDATEIPIEAGTLPHPPAGKQGNRDVVMIPTRDSKGNLK